MAVVDLTKGPRQEGIATLHILLHDMFSNALPSYQTLFGPGGTATGSDVKFLWFRAVKIIDRGTGTGAKDRLIRKWKQLEGIK